MSILRRKDYLLDRKLPLEIRRAVVRRGTEEDHGHEFTEMVLVTAGSGDHVHASCAYPIRRGDLFVIDPGQPHAYMSPRALEVLLFLFDEQHFVRQFPDLPRLTGYQGFFHLAPEARAAHTHMGKISLSPQDMFAVRQRTELIEREKTEGREGYALRSTMVFGTILVDICRAFAAAEDPMSRELRRLGDAMAILEEHYDEPWTVSRLAQSVNVSESTLLRYFKRSTGKTPMSWLIDLRLSKACSLLRSTDRSVAEIAECSGFPDANYFSRRFKLRQGVTPTGFRADSSAPKV